MRVSDLPGSPFSHEHQRLEPLSVDLSLAHLGLQAVLRCRIGHVGPQHSYDGVAVAELQILKLLQLGTEVMIAVVGPAAVDAAALVNCHLGVIERRQCVQVLGVEGCIVAFEPRFHGCSISVRRLRRTGRLIHD